MNFHLQLNNRKRIWAGPKFKYVTVRTGKSKDRYYHFRGSPTWLVVAITMYSKKYKAEEWDGLEYL